MAEQPPKKPKVPRRKELEYSYRSLEEAAAGRHRRITNPQHFNADDGNNRQESILHPADNIFNFNVLQESSSSVGINGLSSDVVTASSSDPPRPTSRRSFIEDDEENQINYNPELYASSPPGLFGPLQLFTPPPPPEEVSTPPPPPVEVFTPPPPPEELHKVIQVEQPDEKKTSHKLCLQFSGLTYTVCKKLSRWQRFKRAVWPGKSTHPLPKPLRLLGGITGEARDGEILAVMGPSGSGKSTLIDALAQRIDAVTGIMTLNGSEFNERLLRNISAYVMQVSILRSDFKAHCMALPPALSSNKFEQNHYYSIPI